jgi:choline dehydrogenase
MTELMSTNWDYIIVGGGSAGCVLAHRLTEDGSSRVLLLEAGRGDLSPHVRIPAGMMRMADKLYWTHPSAPDPSRNDLAENWIGGRLLGGGSAVNAMTWVRGNRADFDYWADLGCDGWDFESLLPYFIKSESFDGGDDKYRGRIGPQSVSMSRAPQPLTEWFMQAVQQAGHPYAEDYNGAEQGGVGPIQISQNRGWRASTAAAYLGWTRHRRNLHVVKSATVTRVVIEDGRAVGVEYAKSGRSHVVRCAREVVLSAGALVSPRLLMLSGVGDPDDLRAHGIPVVAPLPGVGKNLQEHPCVRLKFSTTVPTLNSLVNPMTVIRGGLEFVFRGRGPASSSMAHAALFATLRESPEHWPDFQLLFSPFSIQTPKASARRGGRGSAVGVNAAKLTKEPCVMALGCVLHPHSRGSVGIGSTENGGTSLIRHELIGDARDLELMIEGCKVTRALFEQSAIRRYVAAESAPGPHVTSDAEWAEFIHANVVRGQHPIGTCKMGVDDMAVVDTRLRVRGVAGLRVVDGSVMPTLTSGNTNAPIIAIAERAADLIRADRSGRADPVGGGREAVHG